MGAVGSWRFRVPWSATDAAGIVFYPNYFRWFDDATHRFLTELGFDTATLFRQAGQGLPLLEAKVRFAAPLRHGDEVEVRTEAVELKAKVFRVRHSVWRDGQLVAEGEELRAWVEFVEGKPRAVPLPEAVRQALTGEGD